MRMKRKIMREKEREKREKAWRGSGLSSVRVVFAHGGGRSRPVLVPEAFNGKLFFFLEQISRVHQGWGQEIVSNDHDEEDRVLTPIF